MVHCDKSTGRPDAERPLVAHTAYLAQLYHIGTCDLPLHSRVSARYVADLFHLDREALQPSKNADGRPADA